MVSGFHAIVSRFHVPHFGFLDSGTLVLDSNRGWIPDSLSCIPVPKPRILPFKAKLCCFPNSKSKTFADSGRRRDSRLISREKIFQGNTQGKNFLLWKKISLVGYNAGKILTPLYIGEKILSPIAWTSDDHFESFSPLSKSPISSLKSQMVDALQRAWFQTITITAELCKKKRADEFWFCCKRSGITRTAVLDARGGGGGGATSHTKGVGTLASSRLGV